MNIRKLSRRLNVPEPKVPSASTVTHLHLLAAVNTDLPAASAGPIRILDVGCGTGKLVSYFSRALSALRPDLQFELFGFDVHGAGFEAEAGFFGEAIAALQSDVPSIDWSQRIIHIPAGTAWPYPPNHFDFVVSNQVVEHVSDPIHFFTQVRKVLRCGGVSYHLFPLKHYLCEGHVSIPFAHRILDHDSCTRYIRTLTRLGIGIGKNRPESPVMFAQGAADSLLFSTHYLSYGDLLRIIKKCELRPSFRHTPSFYTAKLRQVLGMRPRYIYGEGHSSWLTTRPLSYLQAITLRLERKDEQG